MRVTREQITGVESYSHAFVHPAGVAWGTLGTATLPLADGAYVVHASVRMQESRTGHAAVINRIVTLVMHTGTVDIVGQLGAGTTFGDTVNYESDLAAADVRFTPSVAAGAVHVLVEARWPGLQAGATLTVNAEIWWE